MTRKMKEGKVGLTSGWLVDGEDHFPFIKENMRMSVSLCSLCEAWMTFVKREDDVITEECAVEQ